MKKTPLLAVAAAAALALTSCSGGSDAGTEAGSGNQPLNIGQFMDITSWDPANADVGFDVTYLSAVYDPLLTVDGDGNPQPALATKWEVSADFKTITMDLRTDAKFSDGEAFTADAAVKNLEYLKKGTRSQEAYTNVSAFKKVDEDTIEIDLKQRDDTILYFMGLGRSWMASPKAIDAGTLAKSPVGSGPYTLSADSVAGSEYHFAKVADHWDAAAYKGDPLKIQPIQDANARANAMQSGQIDVNYADQAAIDMAPQNNWNVAKKVSGWVGLQFSDRAGAKSEIVGNLKVRQALNYAFDGAKILSAIGSGAGEVTNQIFPVGMTGNDPSLNSTYAFSIDKAKALLAEAGYADGFEISLPMTTIYQTWQPSVEQTFKELGIKVKWDSMQYTDYMAKASSYPMFIAFISMDSNAVANVTRQISTPQWYNPTPGLEKFPEVKAQVEKVMAATPDAQEAEIKTLNKLVTDNAFFSVWYQANNAYVSKSNIEITPVTGQMYPTLNHIKLK